MSRPTPSDAERAMNANAESRVEQAIEDDEVSRKAAAGTENPPVRTDLTGAGADPAEGKREPLTHRKVSPRPLSERGRSNSSSPERPGPRAQPRGSRDRIRRTGPAQ
jgi:hypothetical protein